MQVTAGTFALGAAVSRIDAALTVSGGTLELTGTTLNGTGTLTNSATASLINSTVNAPLLNRGTVVAHGDNTWNGTFGNLPGDTLRVDGTGQTSGPA